MKSLKKFLAAFLACVMAFGVMSASAFAADTDNEIISAIEIAVSAPVDGEFATGLCVIDTSNTTLSFLQWVDEDGAILYSSNTDADVVDAAFEIGNSYMVQLVVTAGKGYAFDGTENLTATVNGNDAEIVDVDENGKELAITYTFDCEAAGDGDDDNNNDGPSITFDQVLNFLKTVLLTFIRFLGSLVGIK